MVLKCAPFPLSGPFYEVFFYVYLCWGGAEGEGFSVTCVRVCMKARRGHGIPRLGLQGASELLDLGAESWTGVSPWEHQGLLTADPSLQALSCAFLMLLKLLFIITYFNIAHNGIRPVFNVWFLSPSEEMLPYLMPTMYSPLFPSDTQSCLDSLHLAPNPSVIYSHMGSEDSSSFIFNPSDSCWVLNGFALSKIHVETEA